MFDSLKRWQENMKQILKKVFKIFKKDENKLFSIARMRNNSLSWFFVQSLGCKQLSGDNSTNQVTLRVEPACRSVEVFLEHCTAMLWSLCTSVACAWT